MIDEGLFSVSSPDWIVAQHVHPTPGRSCRFKKPALYMASADEIYISIKAKAGMRLLRIYVLILLSSQHVSSLR